MNFDLQTHTILLTVAGSRCYGIHRPTSDVDVKGVLTVPRDYIMGFHGKFEQADSPKHMECWIPFLTPEQREAVQREKIEGSIYELRKFMKLAADCNPNILDVLFCRDDEVIWCTPLGERLRANADLFISAKAKFTFSGYAHSQLKRIKGHRAWLLNPPTHQPTREEFGLTEEVVPQNKRDVLWAAIRKKLDEWAWDFGDMPQSEIIRAKEDISLHMAEMGVVSDEDWVYAGRALGFGEELLDALRGEKKYLDAKRQWKQYQTWKRQRNEARAALEAEHGYDTKHAAHLVRLLRMGREILETGKVNVWRGDIDAEELLAIRAGAWTYDQLIEWAEAEDAALNSLYKSKAYKVPHRPNLKRLNELCMSLVEESLNT